MGILLASGNFFSFEYSYKSKKVNPAHYKLRKIYEQLLVGKNKNGCVAIFIQFGVEIKDYYSFFGTIPIHYIVIPLNIPISETENIIMEELENNLNCVIVEGGNTFTISAYMHKNGWFDFIKNAVNNGTSYIGYSAGAIMATPTVLCAQWADNMDGEFFENAQAYSQGLGLVDFVLKPHSDFYMKNFLQLFLSFAILLKKRMYCIYEEGAVYIENGKEELYGDVVTLTENGDII